MAIDGKPKTHFSGNLIAFGHRDLPHVVAKADKFRPLPIVPGAGGPHPIRHPRNDGGILPMTCHDLPGQAHSRVQEARLPISMRRLVKIHEIHVDGIPRQVAIELGVQMQERFAQVA
jgi:hypothetical protein